jgi:hypothetical protein
MTQRGLTLRPLLAGGDRRSQAGSKLALARILADRTRVSELVALVGDRDWLVSMRALDLIEKLAHSRRDWIAPHKGVFIGSVADSDKWELRLQVVRALPLFEWTADEHRRVVAILRRDVAHPQTFVRAWALDSLATVAADQPRLMTLVRRHLRLCERSGRKALVARARRIRERLRARGRRDRRRAPSAIDE